MLEELSGGKVAVTQTADAKNNMAQIAKSMRTTVEKDSSVSSENRDLVCRFVAPADKEWTKRLVSVKYGWSSPSRETEAIHTYLSAGSALVDENYDRTDPMEIYFSCKLPKGKTEAVHGTINAKWNSDLSTSRSNELLARVLLITAEKMRDELDCANEVQLDPESPIEEIFSEDEIEPGLPLPSLPVSGPIES
ncbi:hypothetical protein [Streptomyces oceani]|uniref:hypothetical protein n=1 Tax=Streptomyces oceani TaxID=1075402 RepID=UPI001112D35A|nr:hypothetical protein [Streptomyces oceani]